MNNATIDVSNVDVEHKINTVINDCKITVCFMKTRNTQVEKIVLENLLDTFEQRMRKAKVI